MIPAWQFWIICISAVTAVVALSTLLCLLGRLYARFLGVSPPVAQPTPPQDTLDADVAQSLAVTGAFHHQQLLQRIAALEAARGAPAPSVESTQRRPRLVRLRAEMPDTR